jgi:hypothetical protein
LVSAEDRARLEAIVADRNRAQKHVIRARIVLHSAARLAVADVTRRAGVGRPAVWRWQRRFAEAGVDGLLRDATRKPGKAGTMTHDYQRHGTTTREKAPRRAESRGRAHDSALRLPFRLRSDIDAQPLRLRKDGV